MDIDPYFIQIKVIAYAIAQDITRFTAAWTIWFERFVDTMHGNFEVTITSLSPEPIYNLIFMYSRSRSIGDEELHKLDALIPTPILRT